MTSGIPKNGINKGQFKKGNKLSEETKIKISLATAGIHNPFYGKKHTQETIEKIREARKLQAPTRKGVKLSQEIKDKISKTKKEQNLTREKSKSWKGGMPNCLDCGKKLTRRKAKYCLKCVNKGERAPNWKGGITPLALQIRNCFKSRQWRSDIFTRDDFTCQECNKRGGDLEAHHLKEFAIILHENKIITFNKAINCEELWNINNGITLCLKCHNLTKKKCQPQQKHS